MNWEKQKLFQDNLQQPKAANKLLSDLGDLQHIMKHFSLAREVKQHDIIEMVTNCKKWDQQKTKLCYTFTFCHMDFLFIKLYWQHCSSVSTCL